MKSFVCLLGAALLLVTAGGAAAQEFRATVRGQVLDSSKAALPGATVTLTNMQPTKSATAVTNTEGNYTVPFLRPGSYTLSVELSGFQKSHANRHAAPGQRDRDDQRRSSALAA